MAKGTHYRKCTIIIPTFSWTFEIVFTKDPVGYARHIGCHGLEDDDGTTNALCARFDSKGKTVLIFKPDAGPGTIAHEAWHGVRRMLKYVGAGFDNEVVAYHLGYLVEGITELKNKKERNKKNGKQARR